MRLVIKYAIPTAACLVVAGTAFLLLSSSSYVAQNVGPTGNADLQAAVWQSNPPLTYASDIMSSSDMDDYTDIVDDRRGQIESSCKAEHLWIDEHDVKLKSLIPRMFSRLYVDDKHKILYCEVPKVACTNWKRILLILTGKMNTSNPEDLTASLVHTVYQDTYLKRLSEFKPREIMRRLKTYYKFMFVRNPLERLLSAYRNKFQARYSVRYQLRFGTRIIDRYRKNPTADARERGNDVTFPEFVRFLLDPQTTRPFDPHWRPFHEICQPCLVHYDFVGKYETLDRDVDIVLKTLGVRHLLHFPNRPPKQSKTADLLAQAYGNISSSDMKRLQKLYFTDFQLFGYDTHQTSHSSHMR